MKNGFIKLHRQIQDNWLWKSDEPFDKRSAWIDLILMANWEESTHLINGQLVKQRRGEVLTSIGYLAKRWKWSMNKVRRFVEQLTAEGMVRANGTTYGTSLSIEKYAFFQGQRRANGTTVETSDETADGTQHKKNKEELRNARARGSSEDPDAALEEVEAEEMPDWFRKQVEGTFGKM